MAGQPTGGPAASSSTTRPTAGGAVLVGRAHDPAAHDHAVGQVADGGGLLAGGDAEADRHRQVGRGAGALHQRRQLRVAARRARRWCRPARPRTRTRARRRRSPPAAPAWSWAPPAATSATPSASQAARSSALSSWGRSGTIRPLAPAAAARRDVVLRAAVQHHVGVDHQHHRQPPRRVGADAQHVVGRDARRPAPGCRRRGSPGRRPAGRRTARRARSGRRRRRRRRRSTPSTARCPGWPPIR